MNNKLISFKLTPTQKLALDEYLEATGQTQSKLLRQLLFEAIPNFPNDMPEKGKYERKNKNDKEIDNE
jgi:hypothetical protein